jgi:hypothetical protein
VDVMLNAEEIAILMQQDPAVENDGGWQGLLGRLQKGVNQSTGFLTIIPKDVERIPRYAFDYGNGGWENTLKAIFGRTLGPRLGQTS